MGSDRSASHPKQMTMLNASFAFLHLIVNSCEYPFASLLPLGPSLSGRGFYGLGVLGPNLEAMVEARR